MSHEGHQLIIMTTLHSVVRGNVGATLVVARKTSSGGDKPLPYTKQGLMNTTPTKSVKLKS